MSRSAVPPPLLRVHERPCCNKYESPRSEAADKREWSSIAVVRVHDSWACLHCCACGIEDRGQAMSDIGVLAVGLRHLEEREMHVAYRSNCRIVGGGQVGDPRARATREGDGRLGSPSAIGGFAFVVVRSPGSTRFEGCAAVMGCGAQSDGTFSRVMGGGPCAGASRGRAPR